jgi:hypothetical protein
MNYLLSKLAVVVERRLNRQGKTAGGAHTQVVPGVQDLDPKTV